MPAVRLDGRSWDDIEEELELIEEEAKRRRKRYAKIIRREFWKEERHMSSKENPDWEV